MLPVLVVVAIIVPTAQQGAACSDLTRQPGDPLGVQPGSQGGVAGTGVSRDQLSVVRVGYRPRFTGGNYVSTSYGPPWGGIQGDGVRTAGGLRLNGGAPREYFIAVDPNLIALGTWVYLWPNPFGWRGAFLAADTGGAIIGRRIDFYDWRGRARQEGWGRVHVRASATPIVSTSGPGESTTALRVSTSVDTACSATGVEIGGSGAGQAAVREAVTFLGRSGRTENFAGFSPTRIQDAWCAWFLTNVWRHAGVPIAVNLYSGYPYLWAAANHPTLIVKSPGTPATTLRLSVGTALMYGTGPAASLHVNLVRTVNADGTIEVIGGNQGPYPGRVTTLGPCRLTNGTYVRSTCDSRPIWAIVEPSTSGASA
ncbi:MAG: 3D domain-containing protein [Patulibacter sp.]|nr:3D domain-containing protein [Patulibacter sp.]